MREIAINNRAIIKISFLEEDILLLAKKDIKNTKYKTDAMITPVEEVDSTIPEAIKRERTNVLNVFLKEKRQIDKPNKVYWQK